MGEHLSVALVTPTQQVAQANFDEVVVPSVCGQATILPNHAPLLADLAPGVVALRSAAKSESYFVPGGFVEVEHDRVVVLAEAAEPVARIDPAAAARELEDAEAQVARLDAQSSDFAAAQRRVDRARQRLLAAKPS